MLSVKVTV